MSGESEVPVPSIEDTLLDPRGSAALAGPGAGKRIGPYRLIQLIGEGGMGEVWLAEQTEPRRKVAIKVIKAGMDTKEVVARFESERQALALMEHPAIAKVFDGGSTPEGRPFIVMEYVPGVPITEHCDTHRLTTVARLELFAEVCDAVQHAHQKAVIHRDLKPSNILVSLVEGKPQPKIIDWGIAKASGYRLTEKTLYTELGAVIGTPEYMSPEQASGGGQDVDTRTDVYSLGVLLYQLLTGELPFGSRELRSSGYEELRRKLREVDPPKPSTKLSTVEDGAAEAARNRDTDPGALRRQLEGDLDAITMKALEKDRSRRYGTPSDLILDIRRHLRHEPVLARPPSSSYRVGKYIRRHRVGVGLATGVAALLVAFAASMAIQARRTALERDRANAERDRANREREASDKVASFLGNMLGSLKPDVLGMALWKDLHERVAAARRSRGVPEKQVEASTASLDALLDGVNPTETAVHLLDEQILDRAGKTLAKDPGAEPRLAGRLEHTLGATYLHLGLYRQAEEHFKRAIDIRSAALGPESRETLRSRNGLANVYMEEGHPDQAEEIHRKILEIRRKTLGPTHLDTFQSMNNLANAYVPQGRYQEAEKLHREALELERTALGPEHSDTLDSMLNLAAVYEAQGRYAEAEALAREELEIRRRVMGPEDPLTFLSINNIAGMVRKRGHPDAAESLHREALEGMRRVMGPSHPWTLTVMAGLADDASAQGRHADAEKLHGAVLEGRRRALPADHPDTTESLASLASVYSAEGRYLEAERLARQAVTGYEQTGCKIVEQVGGARVALGRALTGLHRYPQAEQQLLEAERLLSTGKGASYRACVAALLAMDEEWEKSEPGKGHAAQAAQWKAALDEAGLR